MGKYGVQLSGLTPKLVHKKTPQVGLLCWPSKCICACHQIHFPGSSYSAFISISINQLERQPKSTMDYHLNKEG